jgi:hypothetical protein
MAPCDLILRISFPRGSQKEIMKETKSQFFFAIYDLHKQNMIATQKIKKKKL